MISEVLSGSRRWCVVCGDNREVLPTIPDKSVDHVITDPPYNAATHKNAKTTGKGGRVEMVDFGFEHMDSFAVVREFLRMSARWVIAFSALEDLGAYAAAAGEAWIRSGFWDRVGSMPQVTGDRPGQPGEGIAIMHRPGRKRWNRGGCRGLWSATVERGGDRQHPATKPLDLMLALVSDFTDPDDVILDPFCGSGTTLVAALRLGRRCIGIEREPKWADLARERCQAEVDGSTLQARRAGQLAMFGGER